MQYRIQVRYQIGNSFGSEEITECLSPIWTNYNIAKENLKAIEDHYKLYMFFEKECDISIAQQKEAFDQNKTQFWFAKDKNGKPTEYWQYVLNLKMDDETLKPISPSWCGYFESLWEAEIILEAGKISFR